MRQCCILSIAIPETLLPVYSSGGLHCDQYYTRSSKMNLLDAPVCAKRPPEYPDRVFRDDRGFVYESRGSAAHIHGHLAPCVTTSGLLHPQRKLPGFTRPKLRAVTLCVNLFQQCRADLCYTQITSSTPRIYLFTTRTKKRMSNRTMHYFLMLEIQEFSFDINLLLVIQVRA